jgi:hypothetical protein
MKILKIISAVILSLLLVILTYLLRFFASKTFAFILIAIPQLVILYIVGFNPVLALILLGVHFFCFYFIYLRLYNRDNLREAYDEITKINRECIENLKSLFKK